MKTDYIIVQAGGKGTRMEYLTKNKPKSLVPVNNLPMLFHLLRKYPNKKFIIIGDYKYDVLKKYMKTFADVKYMLVDARGFAGTCAGITKAISYIPDNERFMLIWSDLILSKDFEIPDDYDNYIGLSGDFLCRWKYENHVLTEESSVERGVAGLFIFKDKSEIIDVPVEGEFVRWLSQKNIDFKEFRLKKTKEYGLLSEYKKIASSKCRPFNSITEEDGKLIKEGIDEQGKKLAVREKAWYKFVEPLGFKDIPHIYSYEPFVMEKVEGKNIYEYELNLEQKELVLVRIVDMLKRLHTLGGEINTDYFSMQEAYMDKTFDRLDKIRDLVPFADQEYIEINGRKCHNVFFCKELLETKIAEIQANNFVLIHGDCTFSNLMLRDKNYEPLLIDPRGYFGYTEMYGDVAYDWAKLYYSIVGNYDHFNMKDFKLTIDEDKKQINLDIGSNGWEDMEEMFLELIEKDVDVKTIKLIHGIIWLSLTTYAWEDYDSICGAFYNGLYYLEEIW